MSAHQIRYTEDIMEKKEVLELKRRLKKETCTISRLAGCYVNSAKEKVVTFTDDFLTLSDEEIHKYLEIANKTLSGTVGNNLIELTFPDDTDGMEKSMLALKNSKLSDDAIIGSFYDRVISSFKYEGHYLILLFYDIYDVPKKTTDGMKLDESEEVYDYILCSICPVRLTKAGLGYLEAEQRIAPRIRDWIVDVTDTGFLYPAFSDRSTDIHHVMVYAKKPADPHKEFWEEALGCGSRYTATEKKNAFSNMVISRVGPESEELDDIIADVNEAIAVHIDHEEAIHGEGTTVPMPAEAVEEVLRDGGISDEKAHRIADDYEKLFSDDEDIPTAQELLDGKLMKQNDLRAEKRELQREVVELSKKLSELGVTDDSDREVAVVLRVSEEKEEEIRTQFVDGRRCIVIPLEDDESASINGRVDEL